MSRASRFDKLENERAPKTAQESSRVAEERFSDAPDRTEAPAPPQAPAMEAALDASPASKETTAPQLKRFEVDGANHLTVDTDELVRLPFRRCPECQRDSSKFDRTCIFCRASLETPEARELNLSLLAGYDTEKAKEQVQLREQHEASIKQIVEEEFKKQVEVEKESELKHRLGLKAGLVGGAVVSFLIAIWARSFCLSGSLIVFSLVLIIIALPHEARVVLGTHMNRRRPF